MQVIEFALRDHLKMAADKNEPALYDALQVVEHTIRQCQVKPCPEMTLAYGHSMQEWFELPDASMLYHIVDRDNGKEEWGVLGGSPANKALHTDHARAEQFCA